LIFKAVFFFIISISVAHAGKAVVIVLETPLFLERNTKSRVLQLVRKNQEVWIHDREFGLSPLKPDYETLNDSNQFSDLKKIKYDIGEVRAGFLETMDRNGNTAYIKKSHVKLIYKDDRESLTNVNPFIEDPTDYRLQEPLPDDYPLTDPTKMRAFAQMVFGPAYRSQHNYIDPVKNSDRKFRKGLAVGYTRKAGWDQNDRFYFGGYGHFTVGETSHTFSSGDLETAREISYQISLGPTLSLDVFRRERWKLSVGGGINLNWNRHFVKLTSAAIGEEERIYEGINFTPRLFSKFHWRDFFIPNVDLVFGIDMQFSLAQEYANNAAPNFPDLWTDQVTTSDTFRTPTAGVMTYLIGFQSNY
tara:strand:+ start:94839 stop:95918 length:1080 start_codon:yes stop_codon:yes gene_type:complete